MAIMPLTVACFSSIALSLALPSFAFHFGGVLGYILGDESSRFYSIAHLARCEGLLASLRM